MLGIIIPAALKAQSVESSTSLFFEKPYALRVPDLSSVTCVFKDSHNIMWFGTENGLYRYDGTNIRYFGHRNQDTNSLPDNIVEQITEDASGHLWVALLNGITRIDLNTLQLKNYTGTNKRFDEHNFTNRIYFDGENIWAGNNVGIFEFDDKKQSFTNVWNNRIPGYALSSYVTSIVSCGKRELVASTFHDVIIFNKASHSFKRIPVFNSAPPKDSTITSILCDSHGTLWIGTWGGGLYRYDTATGKLCRISSLQPIYGIPNFYITSLHETVTTKLRYLWVTSTVGLIKCRLSNNGEIDNYEFIHHDINAEHSTLEGKISDLYFDSDGALWCVGDNGISKCFPFKDNFKLFATQDGLLQDIKPFTLKGDSCFFISAWTAHTNTGLLITNLQGKPVHTGLKPFFSDKDDGRSISGIVKDKYNHFWLSSMAGLAVFDENLKIIKLWDKSTTGDNALSYYRTNGITIRNDTIWVICYHHGLDLYDLSFKKIGHFAANDGSGIDDNVNFSFFTDSKNRLWICGNHLLYKYVPSKRVFIPYSLTPESTGCAPREMAEEKNGKLVVATVLGLVEFDPVTEHYSYIESGILSKEQRVNSVVTDKDDEIWFLTDKHLVHYKPGEKRFILFAQEDGLDVSKGLGELRTFNGLDIFLCQDRQVLKFNSDSIEHPITPPYMTLDMQVNDSKIYSENDDRTEILLPYNSNKIQFGFTGISYIKADQNQYYYQLSGIDKQWNTTYKNAVSYANLAPGSYDFKVKTMNYAGMWSGEKVLHFIITPPYWQTWWFRILLAITVATIFFFAIRYVSQRNLKERILRLEKETAVEKERNRIAQDMHDDLGSGLTKIAILSEVVKKQMNQPEKAFVQLESISESSRTLVDNLQDIVWMLNTKHDQLESLAVYIREYSTKYFEQSDMRVTFDYPIPIESIKIREEQRRNLFMCIKEALNNIAKHAQASTIHIALQTQNNVIRFTVADNGKGFSEDGIRTFANGLKNMNNRMKQANGTFTVDSKPGHGTIVTFTLKV